MPPAGGLDPGRQHAGRRPGCAAPGRAAVEDRRPAGRRASRQPMPSPHTPAPTIATLGNDEGDFDSLARRSFRSARWNDPGRQMFGVLVRPREEAGTPDGLVRNASRRPQQAPPPSHRPGYEARG